MLINIYLQLHFILPAIQIPIALQPTLLRLMWRGHGLADDQGEHNRNQNSMNKIRTQSIQIPTQNFTLARFLFKIRRIFLVILFSPLDFHSHSMNIWCCHDFFMFFHIFLNLRTSFSHLRTYSIRLL